MPLKSGWKCSRLSITEGPRGAKRAVKNRALANPFRNTGGCALEYRSGGLGHG